MKANDPQRRRQKLLATGELIPMAPPRPEDEPELAKHILDDYPHCPSTPKLEIFRQRIYNEDATVTILDAKVVSEEIKKINKFTELLRSGKDWDYARAQLSKEGYNISKLLNPRSKMAKNKVLALLEEYQMDASVRAKMARAIVNKTALHAVETGDWKTALAATKQISEDPETGMQAQHPSSLTQINIDPGFLKALNNVELPKEVDNRPDAQLIEGTIVDEEHT